MREGGRSLRVSAARAHRHRAAVTVRDPAFYAEIAFGGSVGAGESYMLGHWSADDLTALLRLMLRNRDGARRDGRRPRAPGGAAAPRRALAAPQHARRQPAQHRRALRPRQRLLRAVPRRDDDVFVRAVRAAGHDARARRRRRSSTRSAASSSSGRRTTCSRSAPAGAASRCTRPRATAAASPRPRSRRSQYELARERVRAAGLEDRVTVLLEDYRDLERHATTSSSRSR